MNNGRLLGGLGFGELIVYDCPLKLTFIRGIIIVYYSELIRVLICCNRLLIMYPSLQPAGPNLDYISENIVIYTLFFPHYRTSYIVKKNAKHSHNVLAIKRYLAPKLIEDMRALPPLLSLNSLPTSAPAAVRWCPSAIYMLGTLEANKSVN